MPRKLRPLIAATCAMCAAGFVFAGTASAVDLTTSHWDVHVEYDCDADEFETGTGTLAVHNHDTETTHLLSNVVVKPPSTPPLNTSAETAVFGGPVKGITHNGSFRVGFAVERVDGDGEEIEDDDPNYEECVPPDVTFASDSETAPSGEFGAGYSSASTGSTWFHTQGTGTGLTLAWPGSAHVDPRWGFTDSGTYEFPLTAEYDDLLGTQTIDTGTLEFLVP